MFALILLGIIVFVLTLLHFKIKFSSLYQNVERMFHGPKTLPLVGNGLTYLGLNAHGIFQKAQRYCDQYDRFLRIWLGPTPYIFCYDARDVEAVLSSTTEIAKSDLYDFAHAWIGTGLLTSEGGKWKTRRRIITPTFHFKILEDFIPVFNSNSSILIEKLRAVSNNETVNIYEFINLYSLDNICETALGVKINAQINSDSIYTKAVKDIRMAISVRTAKVWLFNDFLFNLSKYGKMQQKALKVLHDTTENVIKRRRQELQNIKNISSIEDINKDDIGRKERLVFLDLLILSGGMNDLDIREEVDTFMFEGHDTVTSGISFALYCLAHDQEVQEKVYKEQIEIFGDSDRPPTYQDLQEMKYLQMAIKESQRLYPSVPMIGRTIHNDLKLSNGYFLPKGSQCILNILKMHRNPNVWPDPNKFNPENFDINATKSRNPYAFVPFSAGLRNCIGQRFAMMEMKSCISEVIRNFKLLPTKDTSKNIVLTSQLILFSLNGINVELENRKKY